MKKIITSESVNIGHPDKTCDVIADAFLDAALSQDKSSQMAVECAIKNNKLFVYGEATTNAVIDYDNIAREVLKDIGYECEFEIIKEVIIKENDNFLLIISMQIIRQVVKSRGCIHLTHILINSFEILFFRIIQQISV